MASIRCETCDLTMPNDNYYSHINGKKHKQKEEKSLFRCDICNVNVGSKEKYLDHINGKRHKQREENFSKAKTLQETGLFLQGLPKTVSASDLLAHFGQFGALVKVDIHGSQAYLNYHDKIQAEEALKHQHNLHGQNLTVSRRQIFKDTAKPVCDGEKAPLQKIGSTCFEMGERQPSTSQQFQPKRKFDGKLKSQPQPGVKDALRAPTLDHSKIFTTLSQTKTLSEQVASLKCLVLAGEDLCNHIQQSIKNDLMSALRNEFDICELFTFGSMTTGLAFKDSDLDVYAHLELKASTHWQHSMPPAEKFKKTFTVAKKCLYRKGHIFNSIVPLQRIKVPIIKFMHINTQVSCDMSFLSLIGHCNSKLLRHYLNMNERFFEFIFFLKYWASVHKFCSTSKLSSFALCMLGLSYLLSLRGTDGNKFLPSVHEILASGDPSDPHYVVENWRCGFNESPLSVVLPETEEFSLPGLLKNFFESFSQIPFETHVISSVTGDLIPREFFEQSPDMLPDSYAGYKNHISLCPLDTLCKADDVAVLHDPFLLKHNLIKRVTEQTLQEFIEACILSAELCAEALKSNEGQSKLLCQLLSPSMQNEKSEGPSNPKVLILLKEPQFLEKSQFKSVQELVSSIFENIFLLKVTYLSKEDSRDSTESNNKILKMENMQDIHEDGFLGLFSCEGKKNVWTGRKKASKFLIASGSVKDILSFKAQQSISEYMAARGAASVNIKFQCVIKRDKVGRILMKFYDMCCDEMWCFVQDCLPPWIFAFTNESSDEAMEQHGEAVKQCAETLEQT